MIYLNLAHVESRFQPLVERMALTGVYNFEKEILSRQWYLHAVMEGWTIHIEYELGVLTPTISPPNFGAGTTPSTIMTRLIRDGSLDYKVLETISPDSKSLKTMRFPHRIVKHQSNDNGRGPLVSLMYPVYSKDDRAATW